MKMADQDGRTALPARAAATSANCIRRCTGKVGTAAAARSRSQITRRIGDNRIDLPRMRWLLVGLESPTYGDLLGSAEDVSLSGVTEAAVDRAIAGRPQLLRHRLLRQVVKPAAAGFLL